MKKNLAKVLASASAVVALILIVILIVTAFGGIDVDDFKNKLVRGLILAISIMYVALAALTITMLFIQGEALHEIIVKNAKGESVRVSVGVIKKEIKKACHKIEGVTYKRIALIGDGFGVTLKLNVKVEDKDIDETEIAIRCFVEDCMAKTFNYHFSAIDINIMQLVPKYKADDAAINAEIQKKLEAKRAEDEKLRAEEQANEEKYDATKEEIVAGLNGQAEALPEAAPIEEAPASEAVEVAPAEEAVEKKAAETVVEA